MRQPRIAQITTARQINPTHPNGVQKIRTIAVPMSMVDSLGKGTNGRDGSQGGGFAHTATAGN
jgi:hypothetical protein